MEISTDKIDVDPESLRPEMAIREDTLNGSGTYFRPPQGRVHFMIVTPISVFKNKALKPTVMKAEAVLTE
jgi:hypothetical protein